ncbi:hypothetical protein [Lactococcus garvieae]|uniref:hypothetical protein n=1 Tax=Lactococcus garvieae TaxID=1363 RepID=UPI0038546792
MNQKTIKGIKREISEDTAINVGFYQGTLATILDKLGTYHLKEALSNQGDLISSIAQSHSETELENIIVTEMINKMSYQEFKEVASCFFSYRESENEILARNIPITKEWFEKLTNFYDKNYDQVIRDNERRKKINDLVTNWYERYQSVIALAEGAFDPFGYLEYEDPIEAEEAGFDLEVHDAIYNSPVRAFGVYEEQIKIAPEGNSFTYVLTDSNNLELFSNPNLEEIIQHPLFEEQVRLYPDMETDYSSEVEVKKLLAIVSEAMTENQSFMDEEIWWGDFQIEIPIDNPFFLAATELIIPEQYRTKQLEQGMNKRLENSYKR